MALANLCAVVDGWAAKDQGGNFVDKKRPGILVVGNRRAEDNAEVEDMQVGADMVGRNLVGRRGPNEALGLLQYWGWDTPLAPHVLAVLPMREVPMALSQSVQWALLVSQHPRCVLVKQRTVSSALAARDHDQHAVVRHHHAFCAFEAVGEEFLLPTIRRCWTLAIRRCCYAPFWPCQTSRVYGAF